MESITKTVAELEASVIRKTNKYVYFKDGTHITYSDFHAIKSDIRKELCLVNQKDLINSVHQVAVSQRALDALYEKEQLMSYNLVQDNTKTDWEAYYRKEWTAHDKTKDKLMSVTTKLYKNLASLPDLNFLDTGNNGIKFIIQGTEDDDYRFCFDAYQIQPNFHSSISLMFRDNKYYTRNGGWMKIIGNTLVLFYQSGDYGIYDNDIAIEAARKIFPTMEIKSYAGLTLEQVMEILSPTDERELPF